jgi:hypothetical protein
MATRQVPCSESGGRAVASDPPNPARPGVVVDGMQAVKQLDEQASVLVGERPDPEPTLTFWTTDRVLGH